MRTWHEIRRFPLAVRLPLVNQLGVDTGFHLLIPYLTEDLGMSAVVGALADLMSQPRLTRALKRRGDRARWVAAGLGLGVMVAQPFVTDMVPAFGRPGLTGTYCGVFHVVSGVAAAVGNAVVGWAVDTGRHGGAAWLPWVCCAPAGLASALGVVRLRRLEITLQ
ncbi:hypothetical protein ACH5AO_10440 [Streptomyces sp. NPDC018964]|uniref:hypothetical protein n=1 Tax=unclassified Streptomyces TaxID=2593676 RepID=UPI0037BDE374